MSKFRQLVEDITNRPQQYSYLTPEHQKALDQQIEKAMDRIDVSELPSAYYDRNPYGVEPQLAGGSGNWFLNDEHDLWAAACELVEQEIQADGAVEYLWDLLTPEQQEDEEFNAILTKEALEYIQKQK